MTTTDTMTITVTSTGNRYNVGTATLTRPEQADDEVRVYLVTVDLQAAEHFGASSRAGTVIGAIVRNDRQRRWEPVAYTNRQFIFDGSGPVYDLPPARNRVAAIRALLKWWNAIDTGKLPANQNPWELSPANRRYLTA
jgi:hypothetical protein